MGLREDVKFEVKTDWHPKVPSEKILNAKKEQVKNLALKQQVESQKEQRGEIGRYRLSNKAQITCSQCFFVVFLLIHSISCVNNE